MTEQDDVFEVNLDDLTINEIVLIEEKTGLAFDAMNDPTKPKGKMLQALAWITKRRNNPDFTWEDAGNLKITTSEETENPTNAAE